MAAGFGGLDYGTAIPALVPQIQVRSAITPPWTIQTADAFNPNTKPPLLMRILRPEVTLYASNGQVISTLDVGGAPPPSDWRIGAALAVAGVLATAVGVVLVARAL